MSLEPTTHSTPAPMPQEQELSQPVKEGEASKDVFYSPTLERYIDLNPLSVNDEALQKAKELGISLEWNDEGHICEISYQDSKRLAEALDATLLSSSEYWKLYHEALATDNTQLLESLCRDDIAEWLDVIYEKDADGRVFMVEHPEIVLNGDKVEILGERREIEQPLGRPGWFDPTNNIDFETGLPQEVLPHSALREAAHSENRFKYWSTHLTGQTVAGIRGTVVSSGTPSLDLDLPTQVRPRNIFLRLCRETLPEAALPEEITKAAEKLLGFYEATLCTEPGHYDPQPHHLFYEERHDIFNFCSLYGSEIVSSQKKEARAIADKLTDMLGMIKLEGLAKNNNDVVTIVEDLQEKLFGLRSQLQSQDSLVDYLRGREGELKQALQDQRSIVFVIGHRNPDTDTVVSSLFEAYRCSQIDPQRCYVPIIQADSMPDEIRALLGDEITESCTYWTSELYEEAKASGLARWVLTDQNVSEFQRFVERIADHHTLADIAQKQDVPTTWEMMGSCSAQIAQKWFGVGLQPDRDLSRILLGATLMDTENRSTGKMTYRDQRIMDHLALTANVEDETELFQTLMSALLHTRDPELLFGRDYKQDWNIMGYAVAKVKGVFSPEGDVLDADILDQLVQQAEKNNRERNFPLTLIKVVDYQEDNETVNLERLYLIFSDYAAPEFRDAMYGVVRTVIEATFDDKAHITQGENYLQYSGVGAQLSRKVSAPILGSVVEIFNQYFYSEKTGLYVGREFLKKDPEVEAAAQELGLELSTLDDGRINFISYNDARRLLDKLGMTALSLPEYWQVRSEAHRVQDEQLVAHLESKGFIEYLDTIILDRKDAIHHPDVAADGDETKYDGVREQITIPDAHPALFTPDMIDEETGLPTELVHAQSDDSHNLFRYWSPDSDIAVPTRGYIFLGDHGALDMKIYPDAGEKKIGIRPCLREYRAPKITWKRTGSTVEINIVEANS